MKKICRLQQGKKFGPSAQYCHEYENLPEPFSRSDHLELFSEVMPPSYFPAFRYAPDSRKAEATREGGKPYCRR